MCSSDLNDAQHTFFFSDDTNQVPSRSGTFTGVEDTPDGSEYNLAGSWSEKGKIQFTVQRPSAVTYNGTLNPNDTDRIDLTSSAGALTIVR